MDLESSKRILKNLVFIKENITQIGKVMDKLIENEYITMDEKADIVMEKSMDTQCHILLDTLIKRGGKAFPAFIEALKISGNGHVAEKILQTDLSVQSDELTIDRGETFLEISDRHEEVIQLIKERELFRTKLNELMKKYTKLKTENKSKTEDIDALQKEINDLRVQAFPVEKKSKETNTEMDHCSRQPNRGQKNIKNTEPSKEDVVDGPLGQIQDTVKEEKHTEHLLDKLEKQTMTIEELTNEAVNYSNMVTTLEDQIEELKSVIVEKDEKIMKLRNSVGKLQIYLEAGKQERERLASELRQQMDKNQKENEERFTRLDDKMDQVIRMMCNGRNIVKPTEVSSTLEIVNTMKSPRSNRQSKFNKKFR